MYFTDLILIAILDTGIISALVVWLWGALLAESCVTAK